MAKYTNKFKAGAIAMLIGAGYPDNPYKLEEVASHLRIPSRTLRRWFKGENGKPPAELVIQEKADLSEIYETIARKMLRHAGQDDIVEDMTGKDAVMAAAIATDKMRLLQGLPTEIIGIIPEFVQALNAVGKDPKEFMNRVIERAQQDVIQ